jgi:hypothetical protein
LSEKKINPPTARIKRKIGKISNKGLIFFIDVL